MKFCKAWQRSPTDYLILRFSLRGGQKRFKIAKTLLLDSKIKTDFLQVFVTKPKT